MSGAGAVKSNACWSGSRNLSCSMSSVPSRASASNLTSSSRVSLRRFRSRAASAILLNEKSCNELRDAVRRYSTDTWLDTHHPLEVLSSKKNLRHVQKFALSTLPVTTLSRVIMGTERKAITFKAIAENEAWLEAEVARLNAALSPLEVRKSGLLNALVSMARTQQIQLPLSFLQGKPSLPGTPSLALSAAAELETREGSVCQELPNSEGAAPRKAEGPQRCQCDSVSEGVEGNSIGSHQRQPFPPLAIEAAPIPSPRRREEKAS